MDTTGLVLAVRVHFAAMHDREGAKLLLGRCTGGFPRLELIWADQGYAGKLLKWVKSELGVGVQVVYAWWRQLARYMPESLERTRFKPKGFHGLPHRWVVEPTFAWLMFQR
ncbi:MAG: IS5/IS1182 family transposase, partial [Meiothermus sp.]